MPAVEVAAHTSVPAFKSSDANPRPTGSLWFKTTDPNLGAKWSVKKFNGTTKLWETVSSPIYASNESALYNLDRTGGGRNIAVGDLYINSGNGTTETDFDVRKRYSDKLNKLKIVAIDFGIKKSILNRLVSHGLSLIHI